MVPPARSNNPSQLFYIVTSRPREAPKCRAFLYSRRYHMLLIVRTVIQDRFWRVSLARVYKLGSQFVQRSLSRSNLTELNAFCRPASPPCIIYCASNHPPHSSSVDKTRMFPLVTRCIVLSIATLFLSSQILHNYPICPSLCLMFARSTLSNITLCHAKIIQKLFPFSIPQDSLFLRDTD